MLFLMPVFGMAGWCRQRGPSGKLTDIGINDKFMKDAIGIPSTAMQ